MLSPVLDAVSDLDVTVAYTTAVRPFDAEGLRSLVLRVLGYELLLNIRTLGCP